MKPQGYNPLDWKCETQGCFNELKRPKIEHFAGCFPGNISFGDVDGIVEINGYFCLLEWKSGTGALRDGQSIMYRRLTLPRGNVVFVVNGCPKTMAVYRYALVYGGKLGQWLDASLSDVKRRLWRWARWAKSQPPRIA